MRWKVLSLSCSFSLFFASFLSNRFVSFEDEGVDTQEAVPLTL